MQEHKTIQSFLDVVAEQIRWKRARPVVAAELERHLEDQRDALDLAYKATILLTRGYYIIPWASRDVAFGEWIIRLQR